MKLAEKLLNEEQKFDVYDKSGKKYPIIAKDYEDAIKKFLKDHPQPPGQIEVHSVSAGKGMVILIRKDGTWVRYIG